MSFILFLFLFVHRSSMINDNGPLKPTPLPWLPVLANSDPPTLRQKVAVDKLLDKAVAHEDCGLHGDIVNLPPYRLSSRQPLWKDSQPLDITSQSRWHDEWTSSFSSMDTRLSDSN